VTIQLNSYPDRAALVILHPNYQRQLPLLSQIVKRMGVASVWIPLRHQQPNIEDFWAVLQQGFAAQYGLNLPAPGRSAQSAARAVLESLRPLGRFALIVEYEDTEEASAVREWIATLCDQMPAGCQIIMMGRRFPHGLFDDPLIRDRSALYPVDETTMLNDYVNGKETQPLLEVFACGQGRALVDGREINQWEGALPRNLFFYLIERGMATRDEIFGTFWPNLSKRDATNVFHVTKRKISELLNFDLTRYYLGFYQLEPNLNLRCDSMSFKEYVQKSAVVDDHTAADMLRKAITLYKGVFLESLTGQWVEERREDMRLTYVDALSSLARLEEKQNSPEVALGLYNRASMYQPHREDIARNIMRLFAHLGYPERALEVYARLERELKLRVNLAPDPRTVELARSIRQP